MSRHSTNAGLPFWITHTAGDDRKFLVSAWLVMWPTVPAYSVMRPMEGETSCPLSNAWTKIFTESLRLRHRVSDQPAFRLLLVKPSLELWDDVAVGVPTAFEEPPLDLKLLQ